VTVDILAKNAFEFVVFNPCLMFTQVSKIASVASATRRSVSRN